MIQSMTGYGKATAELTEKKINVEIKSLNSKAIRKCKTKIRKKIKDSIRI